MRRITVRTNQSLLDIALEQYGDVLGVNWIVEDNRLRSVVDSVEAGQTLIMRDAYINKRVALELIQFGVATMEDSCKATGIGYDKIGVMKVN